MNGGDGKKASGFLDGGLKYLTVPPPHTLAGRLDTYRPYPKDVWYNEAQRAGPCWAPDGTPGPENNDAP